MLDTSSSAKWKNVKTMTEVCNARKTGASLQVVFFGNPACKRCNPTKQKVEDSLKFEVSKQQVDLFLVNTFDEDAVEFVEFFDITKVPSLVMIHHGNAFATELIKTDDDTTRVLLNIKNRIHKPNRNILCTDEDF